MPHLMPSVIGMSLEVAARQLACVDGFRRIVPVPANAPSPGIVTAQTPVAGTPAGGDTMIVLAVNTDGFLYRRSR